MSITSILQKRTLTLNYIWYSLWWKEALFLLGSLSYVRNEIPFQNAAGWLLLSISVSPFLTYPGFAQSDNVPNYKLSASQTPLHLGVAMGKLMLLKWMFSNPQFRQVRDLAGSQEMVKQNCRSCAFLCKLCSQLYCFHSLHPWGSYLVRRSHM